MVKYKSEEIEVGAIVVGVAAALTLGVSLAENARMNTPAHSSADTPTSTPLTMPNENRVSFIVYGDSISQADSPNFSQGEVGNRSWLKYVGNQEVRFVGGFARAGYSAEKILKRGCESGATAPVMVAALGTNPLNSGQSFESNLADTDRLKSECGPDVRPKGFVVTAVGPIDSLPGAQIDAWNTQLQAVANERGWTYVDPYVGMRSPQNT